MTPDGSTAAEIPGGRLLGRGRHGDTWAVDAGPGGPVVLKRLVGLGPAAAEAEDLTARLAGVEAAVAPLAVVARAGDLWLVYPWVDGPAPSAVAGATDGLPARAVARAVEEVHAAGLAHGALSDGNVKVTAPGVVRLLEVGLADLGRTPGASVDADRRELRALTTGTGGPRPGTRSPARGRSGRVAVAGAAAAVVIASAVAVTARSGASASGAGGLPVPRRDAPGTSPVSVRRSVPCVTRSLTRPAGGVVRTVDMDGTGCPEPLVWRQGHVLTVTPDGVVLQFSVGRDGDVLVVGRWRCSRGQLPAVYRPATGQLFYMTAWPAPGRSVASLPAVQTGIRHGRVRVAGSASCQHVEVER